MPIFRVQFRRDTTENWEKHNPILLYGEVGYEVTTTPDLILTKQGDGYLAADGKIYGTPWKDLPYCSGPPGPSPDYQWNGTILMFKKPDGEWGPGQDLVGPVPAHRWVGTALQFQTQTGSWGDLVDLQGTPGNANLVPATTTKIGGVIIGKGLTVNEQGCVSVDVSTLSGMRRGGIAAYYKVTFGGSDGRRPIFWGETEADENYVLCDGGSDDDGGTVPDLRDKMIMGAGPNHPAGTTGGSETHTLTLSGNVGETTLTVAQMPSHSHGYYCAWVDTGQGNHRGTYASLSNIYRTSSVFGDSGSHTHSLEEATAETSLLPPYYALAYIMRVS